MNEFEPASRRWPDAMKRRGISPFWGPKVVLQLALIGYAGWRLWAGPGSLSVTTWNLPGQVLVVLGGVCELWHYVILKRHAGAVGETRSLLTRGGVFRWVRHPMYLGDALMVLGALWIAADVWALALTVAFCVAMRGLLRDEDALLDEKFGEDFRAWAAGTGRAFPRF